jgi:hypothetical protein
MASNDAITAPVMSFIPTLRTSARFAARPKKLPSC